MLFASSKSSAQITEPSAERRPTIGLQSKPVFRPRRGEVYMVDFDATVGAEIQKFRPAVILQNDTANRTSPVTIVAAISSRKCARFYPSNVFVRAPEGGLRTDGVVLLNQIRSIDCSRLRNFSGTLRLESMKRINDALRVTLGCDDEECRSGDWHFEIKNEYPDMADLEEALARA